MQGPILNATMPWSESENLSEAEQNILYNEPPIKQLESWEALPTILKIVDESGDMHYYKGPENGINLTELANKIMKEQVK